MSNIFKISADGLRFPIYTGTPVGVVDGVVWWDPTALTFMSYANGSTVNLGSTPTFSDSVFRIQDNGDATKQIAFEASAITTATTRTVTMPNTNVNLGDIAANTADVADLRTLSGTADGDTTLGTFTGTTIPDSSTIKAALQSLETSVETKATDSLVIKKDGSVAFTADQSMGGFKLTNLAAPTTAGDALRYDQLGAALGISTLDAGGKVPVSQLPNSIMEFQGNWNASTNSPTLADGTGNIGDVYRANVAGTQNLGSGSQTFVVGDWVVYGAGAVWQLAHAGSDAVLSVNGAAGIVTVNAINQLTGDVTAPAASGSQSKATTVVSVGGQTAAAVATVTANTSGINTGDQTITLTGAVTGTGTGSFVTTLASGIDASKIADGSVSSTEFQYLGSVTSDIQTQLNGKLSTVSGDATPSLGGNLTVGSNVLISSTGLREGTSSSLYTETTYIPSATLAASTTAAITALNFTAATYDSVVIDFKLKQATSNATRIGRLWVVTDGTVVSCVETMAETADAGITFAASISAGTVSISYTNASANIVTARFQMKKFQA